MRESEIIRRQRLAYEKMLYSYTCACERGDLDTILSILNAAENDPRLEQMILEVHQQGYQQEAHMPQDSNVYQQTNQQPSSHNTLLPPRGSAPQKRRKKPIFQILAAALLGIVLIGSAVYFLRVYRTSGATPGNPTLSPTVTGGPAITPTTAHSLENDVVVSATFDGKLTARRATTGTVLWQITFFNASDFSMMYNLNNRVIGVFIQDHVVYVATNKLVQAFQLSDGAQIWQKKLGSSDPEIVSGDNPAQILVEQGLVFASGYSSGNLYVLNANTGEIRWHYDITTPALLTLNNGIAYVIANSDSNKSGVNALDARDGHKLWNYVSTMPMNATIANDILYVLSSLATGDRTLSKGGTPLFALNATTGTLVWSTIVSVHSPSPLAVSQGRVVLFTGEAFCGYRSNDGKETWCKAVPNAQTAGQLLFALLDHVYGLYYSTPTTLTLISLDPTDGKIVWKRSIEGLLASSSHIFFAGNALVTGGDFGLRAINPATSEVLWQNGESITSLATGN